MWKEALRRLLWLAPTLFVVTGPIFWALSMATDGKARAREDLPLFFNPNPRGAKEHALLSASRIAEGGPEAREAATLLGTLGGAALPHVLPRLDAMGPEARGRVALALAPVARRMELGASDAELDTPDAAVLFWNRFWEEHQIDFRPAVVRRAVRRFAERPSVLRASEVQRLDTFALADLIDAMQPLKTAEDVLRIRQVSEAAARVTGMPWTVPDGASVAASREVVARWEAFWLERRSRYAPLTGVWRVGATLLETRYGRWVERIVRRGLGSDEAGMPIAASFASRAPTTIGLVLIAWLIGHPLGLALAVALGRGRTRALALALFAVAAGGATAVGLAAIVASALDLRGVGLGPPLVMVLGSTAAASRHHRALKARLAERPFMRTELAFGASPLRTALRALRLAGGPALALSVTDLPALFTAAFVTERAFSLHGLGEATAEAVQAGNLTWLMALALIGTLGMGSAQIAADLIHALLDPRLRSRTAHRVVPQA